MVFWCMAICKIGYNDEWRRNIFRSPCDFHVGCCMRWPKKILYDESHLNDDDDYADDDKDDDDDELYLYEESHLNEDRKEAAKSDDDASMSLIPTANPHFLKFAIF